MRQKFKLFDEKAKEALRRLYNTENTKPGAHSKTISEKTPKDMPYHKNRS